MKRYITRTFTVAECKVYYDTPEGIESVSAYAYKAGKKWIRFETFMDGNEGVEELKVKVDEQTAKDILYRMEEGLFIKLAEEAVTE